MATPSSRQSWRRHNSTTNRSSSSVNLDKKHPLVDEYNLEDDDDVDDLTSTMLRKARELFAVCDVESKGFISKSDMQRLTSELPLTADQLEDVFDSLDGDGNGYLTLYEFTDGFGSFLGVTSDSHQVAIESTNEHDFYEHDDARTRPGGASTSRFAHHVTNRHHGNHDDDGDDDDVHGSEQFQSAMRHLEGVNVLDDTGGVSQLWTRLRRDQPELLGHFEDFIHRITTELTRTHSDYKSLETALKSKSSAHDEEVRRLYEEMELQIQAEKQKILNEEKAKERQLKEEMEHELREKDKQLNELMAHHALMERKLQELNSQESETKQENEKLQKDKEELEDLLEESQKHLDESRSYITQLRQQQREEKRERAINALHLTEGIALERESLVRQLDTLRDVNRKLRDDRDEAELRRLMSESLQQELGQAVSGLQRSSSVTSSMSSRSMGRAESVVGGGGYMSDATEAVLASSLEEQLGSLAELRQQQIARDLAARRQQLTKRGSIMSNYIGLPVPGRRLELDSDIEMDDEDDIELDYEDSASHVSRLSSSRAASERDYEYEPLGTSTHLRRHGRRKGLACDCTNDHDAMCDLRSIARQQPLGASSVDADSNLTGMEDTELDTSAPERLYKVVFVGDSSVGKSSFIYQFCNNEFRPSFQATIGVDFQVKNIRIDGHVIALQLWDTAGQERFRSITKQYFRKADGVLVMYDVTSEQSFRNLRNWMTSVQDGTEEGTVLLMVGNKMDLVCDETPQVISSKDGAKLAEEFGAKFFESSAKTGLGIKESVDAMARMLRDREDIEIERALQLSVNTEQKRGCCGRK